MSEMAVSSEVLRETPVTQSQTAVSVTAESASNMSSCTSVVRSASVDSSIRDIPTTTANVMSSCTGSFTKDTPTPINVAIPKHTDSSIAAVELTGEQRQDTLYKTSDPTVSQTITDEDSCDTSEPDIFYFESDHVALRGNSDYHNLLKTIAILEAQRIQSIKDLDTLHQCRAEALKDPIAFVEKLQQGEDLGLPKPQNIAVLPSIDWERYTSNVDFSSLGIHKHMTRLKCQLLEGTSDGSMLSAVSDETPQQGSNQALDLNSSVTVVRGRLKDESKSVTFNKLWTQDEQRRLEELLVEFPPEEVEAKRWQKIATALGNRTLQQVASRVQKYFIKLAKAGLPVPGRVPNVAAYNKRSGHRHHRFHNFYHQPSTFLQSYEPPVYMSDDDSRSYDDNWDTNSFSLDFRGDASDNYMDMSDDESIPPDVRNTGDYQELLRLKKLRQDKLQQNGDQVARHVGFKCDRCECEPIVGTRWHCSDCPADVAVDFCDDCAEIGLDIGQHNSTHRLQPLTSTGPTPYRDSDYMRFMPGDYNYLDPNYMPAT